MSPPEPSREGLAEILKKVGHFFCLGASQVSPKSEPGVYAPAATKSSRQQTALGPPPDADVHLHITRKLQRSSRKESHQRDNSTSCRSIVDQLVKKLAEKDALYAQLHQKVAALEERAVSDHMAKIMAQASLRAVEEDKAAADAATVQLRAEVVGLQGENATLQQEKEQVRQIGLQLGKKCTALRANLEERMEKSCADMAKMQAMQESYSALLQQCQQMQLSHLALVNAMRQANAKEAALKEQQMEAIMEEARQKQEEAQEREQELVAHIEDLRKWGEEAMADNKQLEARLRQASQLPVLPLAECPLVRHAGDGAQSSVDLHVMNSDLIAVKKPESEEDERSLLLEEQTLARMDHSSIPKPLAWLAMDDGRHALGIPAFTSGSLRDLLGPSQDSGKAGVWLSMVEGMSLIDQGAEALEYVHCSGYVHSDIKPDNLMLDAEGGLMIIDWGSAYHISEGPHTWGSSNGYVRPTVAASTENMGPEDDIRGLCAVGLEMATGHCIAHLLRSQYDCLYSSDDKSSDEEVAQKEEAKESITEFCESHSGLDPLDCMDRTLAAEYLGHICITEEDFEAYLDEEGAPREYLRLLLRALSHPVGCGEAPMPTLQEIRDAISTFLAASCAPSREAALALLSHPSSPQNESRRLSSPCPHSPCSTDEDNRRARTRGCRRLEAERRDL